MKIKEQELTVIVTNPGALLENDSVWRGLAQLALEIAYDKGYLPLKPEKTAANVNSN